MSPEEAPPMPDSPTPLTPAGVLALVREFADEDAFLCDFAGVTSINAPNIDRVIALATPAQPVPSGHPGGDRLAPYRATPPAADTPTLDAAWAAAEAALTVSYRNQWGVHDRKRYDLSAHRIYATRLDADGNEEYEYEARATLPGIHVYAASGPTPAAALRALAARLSASPIPEAPEEHPE